MSDQAQLFESTPVLRAVDVEREAPSHRRATDTERAAAGLARPRAGIARARVLDAIATSSDGLNDFEIARATGLRLYTAAPRRGELLKDGWIVDSGERRPTDSGSLAIVWKLSDAGREQWGGLDA